MGSLYLYRFLMYREILDRRCKDGHLGQFFEARNLKSPALVVGEMKMELVELVHGEHVDQPQYLGRRVKVARHVHHHAAVLVPRSITDLRPVNLEDRFQRRALN